MKITSIILVRALAVSAMMLSACAAQPTMVTAIDTSDGDGASAARTGYREEAVKTGESGRRSSLMMPKQLQGVWHQNSPEGRRQCERYRRPGPGEKPIDEASDPLVGAVVITDRIVHAYAEYGEGDFFTVQDVERLSPGEWSVRSRVSIDTVATDDAERTESVDRFSLHQGKLLWTGNDQSERERAELPGFFKCGPVRRSLHALR
jgi:hypothetical protein